MNELKAKKDIYLMPGEFHFGGEDLRIMTLLGSCIAITLWHPKKLIGGMCHFMLPAPKIRENFQQLNGKYAQDAIAMFKHQMQETGTVASEYQVKIFGGGNMFSNEEIDISQCTPTYQGCIESFDCKNVSCKNKLIAPYLLKQHGFSVINQDLGGVEHRKVIFELWTGDVWVRKGN